MASATARAPLTIYFILPPCRGRRSWSTTRYDALENPAVYSLFHQRQQAPGCPPVARLAKVSETLVTELLRYCKTRYGIDLNRCSGPRDLLAAELGMLKCLVTAGRAAMRRWCEQLGDGYVGARATCGDVRYRLSGDVTTKSSDVCAQYDLDARVWRPLTPLPSSSHVSCLTVSARLTCWWKGLPIRRAASTRERSRPS